MECEQCFENPANVEALIDGEYKRLCNRCSILDGAVVLEEPLKINLDNIKRETVRETLMRMSGLSRPHLRKKEVHLDDLRRVKHDLDKAKQNFEERLDQMRVKNKEKNSEPTFVRKKLNVKLGDLGSEDVLDL